MEIKEFISSGIIEMYCLGLTGEEENREVEKLAAENEIVREEISSVKEALNRYARLSSKTPPSSLKNKILNSIENSETQTEDIKFPSQLTLKSNAEDWWKYLSENNIHPPENFDTVYLLNLPGNKNQVTYLAWAKKGSIVEESHEDEDEYLLMLKGRCSITVDGTKKYYKEGDIIFIPKKTLHRAEALSDKIMILVGQRVAA